MTIEIVERSDQATRPDRAVFAKLKHFLRQAAERAATWMRIGTLLDDFGPGECTNYFVNSGYASM